MGWLEELDALIAKPQDPRNSAEAAIPCESCDSCESPALARAGVAIEVLRIAAKTCETEPAASVDSQRFAAFRRPENDAASEQRRGSSQDSQDSQGGGGNAQAERPYRLTREQGDRCHAGGWDDAEIATFATRHARMLRRGYSDADAQDLAERLTLRDREGDDRRLCVECGALDRRGRCMVAAAGRLPGADRRLEPVPTILQRCEGFAPV